MEFVLRLTEIIELIIAYCPNLKTVNICKGVSKIWNLCAKSIPHDFDEFTICNRTQFDNVMGIVSIKKLIFNMEVTVNMSKFFRYYKSIVVNKKIARGAVWRLSHCDTVILTDTDELNNDTFSSLSHVKHCTIYKCEKFDDIGMLNFMNCRSLNVSGCDRITDRGLSYLPECCIDLNISGCTRITDKNLGYINQCEHLNISRTAHITGKGLSHLTKLKTLNISDTMIHDNDLITIAPSCTSFTCRRCENLTDVGINHLKSLTFLDVSFCPQINHKVIQCGPNLLKINIVSIDTLKTTHETTNAPK